MPKEFGYSSSTNKKAPDLTTIRPPNEGGVIALQGLKYQYHFAAYKCLEMLEKGEIEFVACELHDDVVVKLINGRYLFCQVKSKSGELWTINRLKDENVWNGFLKSSEKFGDQNSFVFVSEQDAQSRVNNKPDLGKMKTLTDLGKTKCTPQELIQASEIIDRLTNVTEVPDKEKITSFFWNVQILTKFPNKASLIPINLQQVEKILLDRGIESDPANRIRIYHAIISKIEEHIDEPPLEARHTELLEFRKVKVDDIERCLTAPFKSPSLKLFNIETDPEHRSLHEKLHKFPKPFTKLFIESRNRFQVRYRKDVINCADYLKELRWKVWNVCVEVQLSVENSLPFKPIYNATRQELANLAEEENRISPPIIVDADYLHGMMCQLTAECDNEWFAVE